MSNRLLLSFLGDDFTGSTDSLEALTLGGIRTMLFLEPPTPALLQEHFGDLQAIGVAGVSRTWSPEQMEAQLRPLIERMHQLGASLFHYKICSTFDSSPEIGSIGRAVDIGQKIYGSRFVPLIVGAPPLRRYTLFGNLFATVGGATYRLDRHPTMRQHPVTPMHESDLRLHLSQQTGKSVALFDILHLTGAPAEIDRRFDTLLETQPDVVLFDVLDQARLAEVGRLIWTNRGHAPLFVVGSSGIEYALTAHWRTAGMLQAPRPLTPPGPAEQLLVVAGSCSPETQWQISWAIEHDFAEVAVDTVRLVNPDTADDERAAAIQRAEAALAQGHSVVIHTSLGPHDPRIAATADYLHTCGQPRDSMGERLGTQLGKIMRALLEQTGLRRAVVAGGDTSGHVARQIGIFALEVLTPIAPGAPLCRAYVHDPAFDGLEIALKGGQNGPPDYFGSVLRGRA
jgi:uncharacterized protein YgbK (DUF1537 family)